MDKRFGAPDDYAEYTEEVADEIYQKVSREFEVRIEYLTEALKMLEQEQPQQHRSPELRETLAELEHEQWMLWAKTLMEREHLSTATMQRWNNLMVPYAELTEEQKDQDRLWADKVLLLYPDEEEIKKDRPEIVCLCGSTRFVDTFNEWRKTLTLQGKIVVSIELVLPQSEREDPQHHNYKVKQALDELHLRKIDLADEVMILNVGGYIGESTASEIAYAQKHNKPITYLEALKGEK